VFVPAPPHPTLPVVAAVGAVLVLSGSLIVSKAVLDALVTFEWPIALYVVLLALIGYGPSVWWCWWASRRWGTGDVRRDLGAVARWSDLAWGPLVWLVAIVGQLVIGAIVVAFDIPIAGNTEGVEELGADRAYVVSLVITAVVVAPVVEELVFRGVVLRGFRSVVAGPAAVLLQGLLFGVAHVDPVRGAGNVGLVLVLSGVGIVLGGAAYLFRRIGPTVVAHALFNGVVLVVVLTGVASDAGAPDRSPRSAGEHVAVVDQSDVTEPDGGGDAHPSWSPIGRADLPELLQRAGVDDRRVLVPGERLGGDRPLGGGDDPSR